MNEGKNLRYEQIYLKGLEPKKKSKKRKKKRIMKGEKEIFSDGNRIIIRFPYDPRLIEIVRNIPGRLYNPDNKEWWVPFKNISYVIKIFEREGFKIDPKVYELEKLDRSLKHIVLNYKNQKTSTFTPQDSEIEPEEEE